MAEYIERSDVLKIMKDTWMLRQGDDAMQESIDLICKLPAANVVKVVRCMDCKHFQQFRAHDGFCQIDGMLWSNDFFCANWKRGESK